ncbi:MAG: hypothetical protein ACRBB6_04220 [Neptuniibacter sp.]
MNDMVQEIDLETVEVSMEQAKKALGLRKNLERLTSNRDFKKVVLEGYFEQEAQRLVHLKAVPSMQTPEHQESIMKQIDAIGAVRNYFNTIMVFGAQAEKEMVSLEETREEILAEEGEE